MANGTLQEVAVRKTLILDIEGLLFLQERKEDSVVGTIHLSHTRTIYSTAG
jgi:hypothetical protein